MLSGIGVTPRGQPRSGLSDRQWAPPSVVAITDWKPAISMRESHGAQTSGADCVVRSPSDGSCWGLTLITCSCGHVTLRIPEPEPYTTFGSRGSAMTVPDSHVPTGLQSIGVIAP